MGEKNPVAPNFPWCNAFCPTFSRLAFGNANKEGLPQCLFPESEEERRVRADVSVDAPQEKRGVDSKKVNLPTAQFKNSATGRPENRPMAVLKKEDG